MNKITEEYLISKYIAMGSIYSKHLDFKMADDVIVKLGRAFGKTATIAKYFGIKLDDAISTIPKVSKGKHRKNGRMRFR